MQGLQVWHANQGFFEFLQGKTREAIHKREVSEIAGVQQPEERIRQERVIVHVISAADAVVCERTVVAHHFNASMAPAAMMCPSASNSSALHAHLISFHEASVASVFILVLWIPRANDHGHVVVENSVGHHVESEECMPPP